MEFIRPNQVLCFLGNLSVLRGQQFRAYRGVQHIQKHVCQFLFPAGIRIVADQVAHQGLWHGRIHPAQGQFRHVPGADYKPSHLVGNIHKDLGPFPGLAVLIGHVVIVHVLSNVRKMLAYGLADIDLPTVPFSLVVYPVVYRLIFRRSGVKSPVRRSASEPAT